MLWVTTLIGQIWFGIEITLPLLYQEINFPGVLGSSILIGISISTLIFFICSYFIGFNLLHLVLHTLSIYGICFYLNTKRRKTSDYVYKESIFSLTPPVLVSIISLIFVFPTYLANDGLFLLKMIYPIHEETVLSASFLSGCNRHRSHFFKIDHPDLYGQYAVTRWLTAYHMSMLRLGYGGYRTVMFFSTAIYLIPFLLLLTSFGAEFLLPIYILPAIIFIPFFTAGFGYISYQSNTVDVDPNIDYISYLGPNMPSRECMHPIYQLLLGSRPLLFSMGLSTLTLLILYRAIACRTSCVLMKLAGFIIGGILPTVLHQAFYALTVFATIHCIFQLWRQRFKKQTKSFFVSLVISFLVLNSVRYYDADFINSTFKVSRQYISNVKRGDFFPFLTYWYRAFGYYPIIVFVLSWFALGIIEKQYCFVMLCSFLVFNFWQTQILKSENMLTFYPFLFTFGVIVYSSTIHRLSTSFTREETRGLTGGLFFVLTSLLFVSTLMSVKNQIMSWEDVWSFNSGGNSITLSTWIIQNTDEKAVFLARGDPMDAIVAISGRSVYISNANILKKDCFEGKIVKKRWNEIGKFLKNTGNASLISEVDFIVVYKYDDVLGSLVFDQNIWKAVLTTQKFKIYQRAKR